MFKELEKYVTNEHYFKRYCSFILRQKYYEGYTENHHIVPESLGGDYSDSNIIRLSARAHFIAHHLLFKACKNSQTAHAFNMMNNRSEFGINQNSKLYAELKEAHSKYISERMSGENNPMYGKSAVKDHITITDGVNETRIPKGQDIPKGWRRGSKVKGKYIWIHNIDLNEETKILKDNEMLYGWKRGRLPMTDEVKKKQSDSHLGKKKNNTSNYFGNKNACNGKGVKKSNLENYKGNTNGQVKVMIDNIEYPSIKHACEALNTSRYKLSKNYEIKKL